MITRAGLVAALLLPTLIGAVRIPTDGKFVEATSDESMPRRSLLLKGGTDATANRHPYFVSIRNFSPLASYATLGNSWPDSVNTASMPHACGGFMLNTNTLPTPPTPALYQYVLTSASCVRFMANPVVIIGAQQSDTSFNPNVKPCWAEADTQCPFNPDTGRQPRWPQVRTTYATYYHELWNNQTGGDYDVALLILDAQALAGAGGACVNCVSLDSARAADGAALTTIGMGSPFKQQAVATRNLQSIRVKTVSLTACNADRAAPTGNYFAKAWGYFNSVRAVNASAICTVPDGATPNGVCRLDDGGPLVRLGAAPADDRVVGIAYPVTQTCNSAKDPSVYTDASKVIDWVGRVVRAASPVMVNGYLAPNAAAVTAAARLGIRTVYGYSAKVQYVNRTSGANAACSNLRGGLNLYDVGGPLAVAWSRVLLKKGFFDPIGRVPIRTINGEFNPFQVNIMSCSNGVIQLEWSSSRNFSDTKRFFDTEFLPANDAAYNVGARYWARYFRCDANIGSPATNPLAIRSFEITQGKGANRRFLAGPAPNTAAVVYAVDLANYPTDCDGNLEIEDGSVQAALPGPSFLDPAVLQPCISTPAEYLAAFQARTPRCVSPNLFGRLTNGVNEGAARSSLNLGTRGGYFWSGSDALSKYIRIGYPEVVGYSTLLTPLGLYDFDSGLSLTEQVGYPANFVNFKNVFVLNIFTRDALQEAADSFRAANTQLNWGAGPFPATWDGWRSYYQHVYAAQGFALPDAALNILKNTEFRALTNCAAECAYSVNVFPSPTYNTVITTQPRPFPSAVCPAAPAGTTPFLSSALVYDGGPRANTTINGRQIEYTTASLHCNADWQTAYNEWAAFFADFVCNTTKMAEAGVKLRTLVNGANGNPRMQAMYFRAFLTQFCPGSSNSLFSGDGFTYTGFGGTLAPLGTEFITSPLNVPAATLTDITKVVQIPMCISGFNGGRPNATGVCDIPPTPVTMRRPVEPVPLP